MQLDDGWWVPGLQAAWVRQQDGSWRASVTYSLQHDHGRGNHLASLPAERVRLRGGGAAAERRWPPFQWPGAGIVVPPAPAEKAGA